MDLSPDISVIAKKLHPYINRMIQNAYVKPSVAQSIVSQTTSTGNFATKSDLAAHIGLDYVEAHPTNSPSINRTGRYYGINFGIVGGATVDESNNILAMLNIVAANGGGKCIIRAKNPADPILIMKIVSIYGSNLDVEFRSPVIFGPSGELRIMGKFDEYTRDPSGHALSLRSNSYTDTNGRTVLPLRTGTGTYANVGDKLVIRGLNGIDGNSLQKDTSFVYSITGDDVTLVDEIEFTAQAAYPTSEWPPDLTTGTTIYVIRFATFNTNTVRGQIDFAVNDASLFSVGDTIMLSDARTEGDMNPAAITGSGLTYKNPANLEMCHILAINLTTNTIKVDRSASRAYSTAYYGGISRVLCVTNSTISGVKCVYNADQTSKSFHTLSMTYAENCKIFNCIIDGTNYRRAQAIRLSYAYNCEAYKNIVSNAGHTDSGEGYGITIYYATNCTVYQNLITGCRHNILLQLATLANVHHNICMDDRISSIDLHGVHSVECYIHHNRISRSNLNTSDSSQPSGIRNGNTSHAGGDHWTIIEANIITGYGVSEASGIDIVANSQNVIVVGNIVIDATYGFRITPNSKQVNPAQKIVNLRIINNVFQTCKSKCFQVIGAGNYDGSHSNGLVDGITCYGNISDGNSVHFEIIGGGYIDNVRMSGNKILNPIATPGNYAYKVSDVGHLFMNGNEAHTANRGIYLKNCLNGVMVNNVLTATIDNVPYTDGGGNTGLISVNNISTNAASGGSVLVTRIDAALAANTDLTTVIANNNSTPNVADGNQAVGYNYTAGAIGHHIEVIAEIGYISMAGSTGPVTCTLWAGGTCIAALTKRITASTTNPNTSGDGFLLYGDFTTTVTTPITIQLRIGPDASTNTIRLRSKFNGVDQPFMIIKEYS